MNFAGNPCIQSAELETWAAHASWNKRLIWQDCGFKACADPSLIGKHLAGFETLGLFSAIFGQSWRILNTPGTFSAKKEPSARRPEN
jgi:hypothetical protein